MMISDIDINVEEAARRGKSRVLAYCGFSLYKDIKISSVRLYLDNRDRVVLQMPFKFRRLPCPACGQRIEMDSTYCRRCGAETHFNCRNPRAIGEVVRLSKRVRPFVTSALLDAMGNPYAPR